ncbi:MAG TPA: GNAT family N-acetyltransferase [Thermoanaerobaculia bacterium]|nr:GNAT family N-acetyltransferase [Thermoanaerobaculia bacterium]
MIENDLLRILAFLELEPLLNVYLIARLRDEGVRAGIEVVEVRLGERTVCVAILASNVVLAADLRLDSGIRSEAVSLVAERIITQGIPIRATISEASLVEILWSRLARFLDPPTVVRLRQPVYALTRPAGTVRRLSVMRFSTANDLDVLVPSCAAMHKEEVGIDPMERDAIGYRERIRELVSTRRSLIATEGETIIFKCELSAITPRAVQLMGVWTHPRHRRRGHARRGLEEVCGYLLGEGHAVTLFVNDFNDPAIHLYESLGFEKIGTNRALIW